MTWLAGRLGVSRTYLSDVAAGRKRASAELTSSILEELGGSSAGRLERVAQLAAAAGLVPPLLRARATVTAMLLHELGEHVTADQAAELADALTREVLRAASRSLQEASEL
jgi:DNA-binding transcriptional regulator YdaS (Cro superfamily)